ncbi:type II toxin-antitoxin system RelE/ParE family toxin [Tahibacter sp.]|uniref:type II toxin-antitoxin system RelE/ParE family toxin n=1 Tax=Tahibacter sp. TaxID=2056211 RepID=UPI0028C4F928|nr:type II toxin-antitoxin system RelE/ParE family toxin [Tahibacter sp.]
MVFIESTIFTADVRSILSEDDYRELQIYLSDNPDAGDVIKDSGGLRKIRWKAKGKGKSGGARVIYYYLVDASQIRMLLIYTKGVREDITAAEKKILRQLNSSWG